MTVPDENRELSPVDGPVVSGQVVPHKRGGRPRDDELTKRLLAGALTLVANGGLGQLTADALATEIGAGKAGIYRRWSNTDDLLAEALGTCHLVPRAPNTGALHGDLRVLLGRRTQPLDRDERAVAAVLGQAHHEVALRAALHSAVVIPLGSVVSAILQQHAERHPDATAMAAPGTHFLRKVVQALWWERLVDPQPPGTTSDIERCIDDVLLPLLGAHKPRR